MKALLKRTPFYAAFNTARSLIRAAVERIRFALPGTYVGSHLCARQVWPARERHLRELVRSIPSHGSVLEIGSWAGHSTLVIASEFKGTITCVDPWMPYSFGANPVPMHSQMFDALTSDQIFPLFWRNICSAGLTDRVRVMRGRSSDVLPMLQPHQFDLVFVDGDHKFPGVGNDLDAAKRLIKPGGVICGDDLEMTWYQMDPCEQARCEQICGQDWDNERCYHPGVTYALRNERVDLRDGFWRLLR